MALRIEDYGLIGDLHTAALVGLDGSIDWLCLPRFDSPACFAALLGSEANGHWVIRPSAGQRTTSRRYRPGTLVLETLFETATGSVRLVDCMPVRETHPHVVRVIEGISGAVPIEMRMAPRFDYGDIRPWTAQQGGVLTAGAGPEALALRADVPLLWNGAEARSDVTVSEGERFGFVLSGFASWEALPTPIDAVAAVVDTETWWRSWSGRSTYAGAWAAEVERSLITLKALTYAPTGGLVAAATTSLPESLGGVRNWDYRFCWLRDAALSLDALMSAGYVEEATAWRDWLLRAVAGDPEDIQIMYGLGGERRLAEYELPHLSGYEGSRPVRVGNAASGQLQLDVYGELLDTLHTAAKFNLAPFEASWRLQRVLLEKLETIWREPDRSIWESRSQRHQFTYSKVMAWLAFERGIQSAVAFGLDAPTGRWKEIRDTIKSCVLEAGFNEKLNTFVRHFETTEVDPSLLLLAQVGFISPEDPRFRGTVTAVERELVEDGFVRRYQRDHQENPARANEGAFIACSFWLADAYVLMKRYDDAGMLFERLLSVANDLGLLSEQYDSQRRRLVGNFPQAFSHVALVNTANNLARQRGPAKQRAEESAGHR